MTQKSPVQNSEFISLATAATLVNYSRDYLGRLAREGKIISQQIIVSHFYIFLNRVP
jgi:hypothetical protein